MTDQNGQAILILPKKTVHIEYVELEEAERGFYSEIVGKSKAVFGGLEANGRINRCVSINLRVYQSMSLSLLLARS
jgi:SNF2 family DNA or RNA helicase